MPDARIEVFTSQVSIASGTSGTDGVAFIKFQYRLGSPLIVTATKHAYVPNSAPWKPIRLPGKTVSPSEAELLGRLAVRPGPEAVLHVDVRRENPGFVPALACEAPLWEGRWDQRCSSWGLSLAGSAIGVRALVVSAHPHSVPACA